MADCTTLATMIVSARNPVTTVMVAVLVLVVHTCINSSSNAYGEARPNTHSHFNRDYMYNNRVNGYQQYTDRENVRYNGQDYRCHTQHGNNSHDRSEYVRQDHPSNTWRNSGGRRTSVSPEMYTDPRDENKTYDRYTTQYIDRYAQHMDLKN